MISIHPNRCAYQKSMTLIWYFFLRQWFYFIKFLVIFLKCTQHRKMCIFSTLYLLLILYRCKDQSYDVRVIDTILRKSTAKMVPTHQGSLHSGYNTRIVNTGSCVRVVKCVHGEETFSRLSHLLVLSLLGSPPAINQCPYWGSRVLSSACATQFGEKHRPYWLQVSWRIKLNFKLDTHMPCMTYHICGLK